MKYRKKKAINRESSATKSPADVGNELIELSKKERDFLAKVLETTQLSGARSQLRELLEPLESILKKLNVGEP